MDASKQWYLTVASVLIAALAAAAATTQSFLAWSARHDQFRSAVFAQGVTRCGEAISDSNEYIFSTIGFTNTERAEEYRKFIDASLKLERSLETLQLLAGPIAPEFSEHLERIRTKIQSDYDRMGRWYRKEMDPGKIGASITETTNAIREACKLFVQSAVFK
jgi:hypothetical protein